MQNNCIVCSCSYYKHLQSTKDPNSCWHVKFGKENLSGLEALSSEAPDTLTEEDLHIEEEAEEYVTIVIKCFHPY